MKKRSSCLMRHAPLSAIWLVLVAWLAPSPGGTCFGQASLVLDFEELPLASGAEAWLGTDGSEGFETQGTRFLHTFVAIPEAGPLCCWDGWSYSRATDRVTPGPNNQFSAFPGSGSQGSQQYAIGYSAIDGGYGNAPLIELPLGWEPATVDVANTTYAALAMRDGAPGFTPPFGGLAGSEPDWFRLTIYGRDEFEQRVGQVDHYLADFRFANAADDFIQAAWETIDLTPLQGLGIRALEFRLASSDAIPEGPFAGILTPAYFALDNLGLQSIGAGDPSADFNRDGRVDSADLARWFQGWGEFTAGGAATGDGDANGDARVDGADLLLWQQQFGDVSSVAAAAAFVPEGNTLGLALLVLCAICIRDAFRVRYSP